MNDSGFVIIRFLLTTAWTPATAGTPNILGTPIAEKTLTSEWAAATAETQNRVDSSTSDNWKTTAT